MELKATKVHTAAKQKWNKFFTSLAVICGLGAVGYDTWLDAKPGCNASCQVKSEQLVEWLSIGVDFLAFLMGPAAFVFLVIHIFMGAQMCTTQPSRLWMPAVGITGAIIGVVVWWYTWAPILPSLIR